MEAEFPFETLINVYHAILHRDPSYRSRCSELAMRWTSGFVVRFLVNVIDFSFLHGV
jgi:hypothetical protein